MREHNNGPIILVIGIALLLGLSTLVAAQDTSAPDASGDAPVPNDELTEAIAAMPDCVMQPVYYDEDESSVRADAKPILRANADCYQRMATALGCSPRLTVIGHTSTVNMLTGQAITEEYTLALGERVARSHMKALRKLGVPKERMTTKSKGSYEALFPNPKDALENQQNRRVEFVFEPTCN